MPAFRGNLGVTSGFLLAALGVLAFTWWALWTYTDSVQVTGTGLTTVRVVAVVLAVLALSAPIYGALGFVRALRARSAAGRGDLPRARMLAEDARDAMWFVVGLGLTALAVGFLAYLLSANGGALRRVMFDWDYKIGRAHV